MLKSKKFNIILALIAAISLWAYVLGEINPTSSTVVRNVPINFINEEALEAEGLIRLSSSVESVNITISGQRTAITRADADDFTVTADMEALHEGENTVRLNVVGPRGVEIERTNIEKITIVVDKKVSDERPVETSVTGEISEDKEASILEAEKDSAVITGPETLVKKVKKLTANIDAKDIESKEKTFSVEMTPVDENNVKVEGVTVEGGTKMEVTAVMLSKKTVHLNVPVVNQNSGGIDRDVEAPDKVVIRGSDEALADVGSITCRSIDLRDIKESGTVRLEPILPEGVELSDSDKNLTARITVKEMVSKTFNFTAKDIIFDVEAMGLSYKTEEQTFEVTVTGRESIIESLTNADFILSVNTEGLEPGTHKADVKVKCRKDVADIAVNPSAAKIIIE